MPQSRIQSLAESCLNIAVGYSVAVGSQYIIFPIFSIEVAHTDHLLIGAFFTVVSLIRSYCLRRFFNWLHG